MPFIDSKSNAMEICNECCIYFLCITFLTFTDLHYGALLKYQAGYLAIAIICFNFLFNFVIILFRVLKDVLKKIKRCMVKMRK
jgi:hypothetical protein